MANYEEILAKVSIEFGFLAFLAVLWYLAILTVLEGLSRATTVTIALVVPLIFFIGSFLLLSAIIVFLMVTIARERIFC